MHRVCGSWEESLRAVANISLTVDNEDKGLATMPCGCLEKPRPKENVGQSRLAAGKQSL